MNTIETNIPLEKPRNNPELKAKEVETITSIENIPRHSLGEDAALERTKVLGAQRNLEDLYCQNENDFRREEDLDPETRFQEAQKTLERVDFKIVQEIFSEMARKAGNSEEASVLKLQDINITNHIGGAYHRDTKTITIGANLLKQGWRNNERINRVQLRKDVLSILMHEEAHAVSKNVYKSAPLQNFLKQIKAFIFGRQKVENNSGYDMGGIEKRGFSARYKYFNEGITDKIGERAFDEYLNRTGEKQHFTDQLSGSAYSQAYLASRAMLEILTEIISANTGIPSEVIEDSLIQGYIVGIDLDESEIGDAFHEIITPEIQEKMAQWTLEDKDLPVPEMYEISQNLVQSEESREKIRKAYHNFQKSLELL